jgi:2-dehydropantoate 2-reductase
LNSSESRSTNDASPVLEDIVNLFTDANIPCQSSDDIKHAMWKKFLVNCTYNAISAIGDIEYGKLYQVPEIKHLIEGVTEEVLKVAEAEGVFMTKEEAAQANESIFASMKTQKSSTAQDLTKNKKTEIDLLNGFIVESGKKHQIETPYNAALHALVKMAEQKNTLCL